MKQVRLIFWLLILGFMGLLFFQNREYLLVRNSLRIDLWFGKYTIPEISNGLYFLGCFLIGLLLAYFYQLPERFRSSKTIKHLNATIASLEAAAASQNRPASASDPTTAPPSAPAADVGGPSDAGPPPPQLSGDAAAHASPDRMSKES